MRVGAAHHTDRRTHDHVLLTAGTMRGFSYVQIVCVKQTMVDAYKRCWPALNFFELPDSATKLSIGASRHWMLKLAKLICPDSFRYCFVLDDNVVAWKAVAIGDNDVFFNGLGAEYPREVLASGKLGKKKDLPLSLVLSHFQRDPFRDELAKFALVGFNRLGQYDSATHPFARRLACHESISQSRVLRAFAH